MWLVRKTKKRKKKKQEKKTKRGLPDIRHANKYIRIQHQTRPRDNRNARLALAQPLTSKMQRRQRRRTRRINAHAGPAQVEKVRHAVGRHAGWVTRREIPRQRGRVAELRVVVVPEHDAAVY